MIALSRHPRRGASARAGVSFVEVEQPEQLSAALEKMMPRLREALQLADAPMSLDLKRIKKRVKDENGQMQTVAGPAYYSIDFGDTLPQELSMVGLSLMPTMAVTEDGWLAFSMARTPVRSALNGGVHLTDVAGDVQGSTTNGGLHIELTGSSWDGEGLDVETTNGGVTIRVPEDYSARLETGTVNGGIDLDFPVTVQGRIGRRLTTTLGDGGPTIRAFTTNGGVRVTRRGRAIR